ncbi:phage tail tube protein [Gimesia panareensis]|uniref:phage tail tube protein n=1 Tax=Gimesia panareensis TaxID=2527978 RepID=UPI0011896E76|nr:phage tail tube protein [Gimesia panareensis]QDU53540.1 hypothetical protein Pan110_59320 [Gimesia panareensis]
MPADPVVSRLVTIAIDSALPFDTSSIPLEFVGSETLHEEADIVATDGMRGTIDHNKERTREGLKKLSGSIKVPCSRIVLDALLPYITGGDEATNIFPLEQTLQEFVMMVDRGAKVYTYSGCRIARASFNATQGQILMLDLDIEAETETTGDAGTFPSLTFPTEKPYIMKDGVLTLQGSTREFSEFNLTINNVLDTERYENALTRYTIPITDRTITLATNHPWSTDHTDLEKQALDGSAGTAVFTNAAVSGDVLTFAMAAVQYKNRTVTSQGQPTMRYPLEGDVRSSGSTAPLIITNAHS